jgi:hypothetical protein
MYDYPIIDGVNSGENWGIMSCWAFDKLGWHPVTVDVIRLVVDGEKA